MYKYIYRNGDKVYLSVLKPKYYKRWGEYIAGYGKITEFCLLEFRTLSNFPPDTPVDGCLYVMDHDDASITLIECEGEKI